jgi:hypothetical protein
VEVVVVVEEEEEAAAEMVAGYCRSFQGLSPHDRFFFHIQDLDMFSTPFSSQA